jgi:hypothetical protein
MNPRLRSGIIIRELRGILQLTFGMLVLSRVFPLANGWVVHTKGELLTTNTKSAAAIGHAIFSMPHQRSFSVQGWRLVADDYLVMVTAAHARDV